jgi:IS30 family transposase
MVGMKGYTHLSDQEREQLFVHRQQGKSVRAIGQLLGRSHATIVRELRRNAASPATAAQRSYSPSTASRLARQRRKMNQRGKLTSRSFQQFVIRRLTRGWSPEQIAGRLKLQVPHRAISHETIYQFIYHPDQRSLRLWEFLRRGQTRRRAHFGRHSQTRKYLKIPNRLSIEQRPSEANERRCFGHFESDLLIGRRPSLEVISVTVDRRTGYVLMDKLPRSDAETRAQNLINRLGRLPLRLRTLTVDNGNENYGHAQVTRALGCPIFFCHPYQAWEKGTVENTIGLVRWYVPKGTDLSLVSQGDLHSMERDLNDRPRKRLGFYTPSEIVYKETGWCI